MTVEKLEYYTTDLVGCARCHGEGHPRITFFRLTHAFQPQEHVPGWTYWAPCPVNGEPILMRFV